jgi:hypothetical protein
VSSVVWRYMPTIAANLSVECDRSSLIKMQLGGLQNGVSRGVPPARPRQAASVDAAATALPRG